MNPKPLVDAAILDAQAHADIGKAPRDVHRNRSKRFVEGLAGAFRNHYGSRPEMRILSRHFELHREEFGLNELLFDVLVCEISSVQSATDAAQLTYVTKGLWAVESEFHRDSREAIFDFNKLVLAATVSKLFVGPMVKDEASFIRPLLKPAAACSGEVYVALVPHPADWPSMGSISHVYELSENQWFPVAD